MFVRILAVVVLIALLMAPISVFAQEDGATPVPTGEESAVEVIDRPPTEYFAYGAVGLLLLLLLLIGVGYVRMATKTSGAE
jgi:hypothetical protein